MKFTRILHLTFAALIMEAAAIASPITFTMTATATGTLAGQAFTNAAITVVSFADTSQLVITPHPFPGGDDYVLPTLTSSITVAGVSATFTNPTYWEVPQRSGDIIFGDAVFGSILGFTKLFSGLEIYDLRSSFGPVSQNFDFVTSVFNGFQNIPTSSGNLSLIASDGTFTAVAAVPEPTSFVVAALGLAGLLTVQSGRRRH